MLSWLAAKMWLNWELLLNREGLKWELLLNREGLKWESTVDFNFNMNVFQFLEYFFQNIQI